MTKEEILSKKPLHILEKIKENLEKLNEKMEVMIERGDAIILGARQVQRIGNRGQRGLGKPRTHCLGRCGVHGSPLPSAASGRARAARKATSGRAVAGMPVTNMWCAHTMKDSTPMELVALTHAHGAWVEGLSPPYETRDYVKKVLANTNSYAAILTAKPQSLKARLGQVGPRGANAPAENTDLP